ncbi:MAG TPA: hypothetical protein VEK15_00855 [Vicinamibacteria bacterium]|nr:hypothetical protein [Vicinamibacteria bacterium]
MIRIRRCPRTHEVFVLNGVAALLAATAWLWWKTEMLLQYFYYDRLLALTHLVTLGFLTSMMMGVLHRLSPMLLKVEASSRSVARFQLVLFLVGSWGMIAHFWLGEAIGMSWSALLVLGAALLQLWNFRGLFRASSKTKWPRLFVASSLVFLLLAASLGVLLALVKAYDVRPAFLADDHLANLFAHAHLAAVGWVANMIFGFQLEIVPTTEGASSSLPLRFALLQVGTVGLTMGFLGGVSLFPFALMIVVACLWQGFSPARSFLRGRTREWDMAPLFVLAVVASMGLVLALGWPEQADPARGRVQLAYGFLGLYGFMVLTVSAVAPKLFPIWVWKERYRDEYGKHPVPGMKELPDKRLIRFANSAILLGTLSTTVSICLAFPEGLLMAATILLAGVCAFVTNLLRIVRHSLLELAPR